jgi:hypothetical protein
MMHPDRRASSSTTGPRAALLGYDAQRPHRTATATFALG